MFQISVALSCLFQSGALCHMCLAYTGATRVISYKTRLRDCTNEHLSEITTFNLSKWVNVPVCFAWVITSKLLTSLECCLLSYKIVHALLSFAFPPAAWLRCAGALWVLAFVEAWVLAFVSPMMARTSDTYNDKYTNLRAIDYKKEINFPLLLIIVINILLFKQPGVRFWKFPKSFQSQKVIFLTLFYRMPVFFVQTNSTCFLKSWET